MVVDSGDLLKNIRIEDVIGDLAQLLCFLFKGIGKSIRDLMEML